MPESTQSPTTPAAVDPVRARRLVVAKWTKLANRVGYLLFLIAMVTFVLGFFFGFSGVVATIVTVSMVIGSILLAPALVLGYAVKAAERDDRERGF
jgi:membrane-bound ClpP family serine protease